MTWWCCADSLGGGRRGRPQSRFFATVHRHVQQQNKLFAMELPARRSSRLFFAWLLCAAAWCCAVATGASFALVRHEAIIRRSGCDRTDGIASLASLDSSISHDREEPVYTSALLRVSYDGQHFTGWSSANDDTVGISTPATRGQPIGVSSRSRSRHRRRGLYHQLPHGHVRSVQGELRKCFSKLYGNVDRVVVEGCSRTDRGVHARGLVAHVYCPKDAGNDDDDSGIRFKMTPRNSTDPTFAPVPTGSLRKLLYAINRMLAPDVRVVAIARLPNLPDNGNVFHPTLSSTSKTYCYQVSTTPTPDVLERRHEWQICDSLDLAAMQRACRVLEGRHDFQAFQGAPRGSELRNRNTVCTLLGCSVAAVVAPPRSDSQFEFRLTGDRFVHKMVRFVVGALVAVGRGQLTVIDLETAIRRGVRPRDWECAPPHGLALQHVQYDTDIDWITEPRDAAAADPC